MAIVKENLLAQQASFWMENNANLVQHIVENVNLKMFVRNVSMASNWRVCSSMARRLLSAHKFVETGKDFKLTATMET